MRILLSFDIDGTLEVGDPPGPITIDMVRRAQGLGCLIGSCSDRTLSGQRSIWAALDIQAGFVSLKHRLAEVKAQFQVDRYCHIGDTNIDEQSAREAGFDFLRMDAAASEPWVQWVDGLGSKRDGAEHTNDR